MKRLLTQKLVEWKNQEVHKPLIIRGARQVGKSHLVKEFATNNFTNFVNINLDKKDHFNTFNEASSVEDFIQRADVFFKESIDTNTLIFIDEIQNSPNLINLLRFFYEDYPHLYVIGAGSLLEARIKRDGLKIPVGRIEYLYLHPMNFEEFLLALKEDTLLQKLNNVSVEDSLGFVHDAATKKFKEYTLIGGMPEAVSEYAKSGSITKAQNILGNLQKTYADDVSKYAKLSNQEDISTLIDILPKFAGSDFTYEEVASETGLSFYSVKKIMKLLDNIMLITIVYPTTSKSLPLNIKPRSAKKLAYLDIGFINYAGDKGLEYIDDKKLDVIFKGRIGEQIASQLFISNNNSDRERLRYWTVPKEKGDAELDLTFSYKGRIVGVEIKNSTYGKLKSLYSFGERVEDSILVRIYTGELRFDPVEYAGNKYHVLSIPFYLIHRLNSLLDEII